jgi:hypothetical protein
LENKKVLVYYPYPPNPSELFQENILDIKSSFDKDMEDILEFTLCKLIPLDLKEKSTDPWDSRIYLVIYIKFKDETCEIFDLSIANNPKINKKMQTVFEKFYRKEKDCFDFQSVFSKDAYESLKFDTLYETLENDFFCSNKQKDPQKHKFSGKKRTRKIEEIDQKEVASTMALPSSSSSTGSTSLPPAGSKSLPPGSKSLPPDGSTLPPKGFTPPMASTPPLYSTFSFLGKKNQNCITYESSPPMLYKISHL